MSLAVWDETRFECPNCHAESSVAWGHEAGAQSGRWLCAQFAAERYECGCSLDFGLCNTHSLMVRNVMAAISGRRLSGETISTIRMLARMPADEQEFTSWVRSAGPRRIEVMVGLLIGRLR